MRFYNPATMSALAVTAFSLFTAAAEAKSGIPEPDSKRAKARVASLDPSCTDGHEPIVVAVIDTGIDLHHPLLRDFLWSNPGETGLDSHGQSKTNNQIDDDKNGFVDDVHGWNFAAHTNDIQDVHGHGSHVSGLITASMRQAIMSPSRKCHPIQLMVLKYFDAALSPHDTLTASTAAIKYAVQQHARMINFSSGGFEPDRDEQVAVESAERHHILIVAAAGNNHDNNDRAGFYPASYKVKNVLAVAALDKKGQDLVDSSNFGARSVHLAAPGQSLMSTVPGGSMGPMTGTSQAAAYMSGVVAEMLQRHPQFTDPSDIIQHLTQTVTLDRAFRERVSSGGKVNPALALTMKGTGRDAFGYRNISSLSVSDETVTIESASQTPLLKQSP